MKIFILFQLLFVCSFSNAQSSRKIYRELLDSAKTLCIQNVGFETNLKLTKDNFDYFQNKYIEKANEQKQYYKSIENSSLSRKVIFNKKASQLNELIDFYKVKTINKMLFLDTTPEFLPEFPKIEQIIFSNVRIVPIPNLDSVASYKLKNDLLKKYISQSLTFQNECLLQIEAIEKATINITEAKIITKDYYQKAIDIEKKNSNYLMYIDRQCCSFIEVLIENKKDLSKLPENWKYYLEKVNSKKNSIPKDPK